MEGTAIDQLESVYPVDPPLPLPYADLPTTQTTQPFELAGGTPVQQQQRSPPANLSQQMLWPHSGEQAPLRCPRCNSFNTKFSYYNNYNMNQPRHICMTCCRRWTVGGALRDVAISIGGRGSILRPGRATAGRPASRVRLVHTISSNGAPTSSSMPSSRWDETQQLLAVSPTAPPPVHGQAQVHHDQSSLRCPRCSSYNTKFSYYNNHSMNQLRYHCNTCRRRWTDGGKLRNVPAHRGIRRPRRNNAAVGTPHTTSCKPLSGALPALGLAPRPSIGPVGSGPGPSSQPEALGQFTAILATSAAANGDRSGAGMLSFLGIKATTDVSLAGAYNAVPPTAPTIMQPPTIHSL